MTTPAADIAPPEALLCHHCRYDLTGLADVTIDRGEVTCPECGGRTLHTLGWPVVDRRWRAGWRALHGTRRTFVATVLSLVLTALLFPLMLIPIALGDAAAGPAGTVIALLLTSAALGFATTSIAGLGSVPRPVHYPFRRWRTLRIVSIIPPASLPVLLAVAVRLLWE